MAYEEKFYIDYINKRAVKGLSENVEVQEWKQFHGSIIPIRVYAVKPIANANKPPFFEVEPIEPLNLKLSIGVLPDQSRQEEVFQSGFTITLSSWVDDTATNSWTGSLDLDDDDLGDIVSGLNPLPVVMQFEFQVSGAWVTGALLPAKIYKTINISN